VKSIVFTTLLGKSVPAWTAGGNSTRPDADVLMMTLRSLIAKLGPITGVPHVRNPSMATENLARTWTRTDFVAFRKELRAALLLAIQIRKAKDPAAWRLVFGPTFPTSP
jgi:hypothetical protein